MGLNFYTKTFFDSSPGSQKFLGKLFEKMVDFVFSEKIFFMEGVVELE